MKSFLLDSSGDYVIRNNEFVLIEGDEELAQCVRVLLQTSKEEWFLDTDLGLDRETIFSKQFNEVNAKDSIIETVLQESRIESVEDITFSKTGRLLEISLSLLKADGELLNVEGVSV